MLFIIFIIRANRLQFALGSDDDKIDSNNSVFIALAELNDVKWSAYRTAMKLRCIQKAAGRRLQMNNPFANFNRI